MKWIIAMIAFLSLCLAGCNSKNTSNSQFRVGVAAGYAPFVSVNSAGEYEGFDIEVAQAIAKKMGRELKIFDLGTMASLFIALDQKKIDAIFWALSITRERLEKCAMVPYQGEPSLYFSFLFPTKKNYTTLQDFEGLTVATEIASCQEAVLEKYSKIKLKKVDKVIDGLLELQYGKVEALFVEPAIARKYANAGCGLSEWRLYLEEEDKIYGVGAAIAKENTALIVAVTEAIEELKNEGALAALEKKWGLQ